MSEPKRSVGKNPVKKDPNVLGRSAATGRWILKPASKPGRISVSDARKAAEFVNRDKSK